MKAKGMAAGKNSGRKTVSARSRHLADGVAPDSFLHALVDHISLPIVVIGPDLRITFINPAGEILFGDKEPDQAVGKYCHVFFYGSEKSCAELGRSCPLIECQQTNGTVKREFKLEIEDEFPRYYEIIATPLLSRVGKFLGIVEIFNDVTDWKLFEKWLKTAQQDSENLLQERTAKLLESNKSLRREVQERQRTEMALLQARRGADLLYRVIPSAIFTVDLERRITSWNDKAEALTGYTSDEIVGKSCSTFALYPCTGQCGIYSDSIPKPIMGRECVIKTKSGDSRIISKNGDFLLDDEGHVIGAVESFEDITHVKKYEEELSSERDKLKGMLSAMGQGMHILGPDFVIEYQNDDARSAFGERLGQKCYQVYREQQTRCEDCLMHAAISSGTIQRTEILLGNGRSYALSYTPFMDVDGRTKVLVLSRDITEEKLLQAETLRAVQLASVGELAAGVAHEINNPINGIINYAQIIQDEAGDNDMMLKFSDKIIREGERVATIVSNLLSFARQHDEESERIYLADVVNAAVDLIRHQFSKNCILLEIDIPADLPPVFGHHQQLQQVFLNLFSNARYALNQKYVGKDAAKKITVTGGVTDRDGRQWVRIVVQDLGTGIPAAIVQKIFEPFYSSKTTGEGTGLGLSISREIIEKHGGTLDVKTEEGAYTKMIIDIPVYAGAGKP